MISHYSLYEVNKLQERFNLPSGLPKGTRPHYNAAPTLQTTAIFSRDGKPIAQSMIWGLVASGSKDMNSVFRYKTYNLPSEKIMSRHSWEIAIRQSRCLIPVNGFYLLQEGKNNKRAFFVHLPGNELFAIAGVYKQWQDPQDIPRLSFSMLTVDAPAKFMAHGDRLPVIIASKMESAWLDEKTIDTNSIYTMLRSFDTTELLVTEVSPAIYTAKTSTPDLIVPLSSRSST